jgi:soluble lytic murein transglycosylase-like protein
MEPATSLSASALVEHPVVDDAATSKVVAVAPHTAKPTTRRWVMASVGLNLALGGGLVAFGLAANERLSKLQDADAALLAKLEQQHAQLVALDTQGRTVEAGLADVTRAVSSHTHEEALFLKMLILKPSLDQALARRIAVAVQQQCALFGQDPNLVLAIMYTESDFVPSARSAMGAVGLMQVMPHWKKVLGLEQDLTDPEVSIRAGVQILGFYQQMYRDLDLALTAYNRGPGPVDGALVRGASPANGYAARVLGVWEKLKALDSSARP